METWHYLRNQFLNATVGNYKKMLKLSNYHDAYLHTTMINDPGDPDWATLYNRYHPFHEGFVGAYTAWKAGGGVQKGQTLNLDQLLHLLTSKVNKWDALIQAVDGFEKGKPNYMTLFPEGLKALNHGAKTPRITAVKALGESLAPFALANPAIAAIKLLVDDFYTLLDEARDNQEGAKGSTKQDSADVETKRVSAGTEQYRNLGFLINKGAEFSVRIAPFFELTVLQRHDQVLFNGTLDANDTEAILIHTFVADDVIRIKLTGTGQASFYLASVTGGTDSDPVTIAGDTEQEITLSAFGVTEWGTHRFLTGVNQGNTELHFEIEFL